MTDAQTTTLPTAEATAARNLEVPATALADAVRATLLTEGKTLHPDVRRLLQDKLDAYDAERAEFQRVFPRRVRADHDTMAVVSRRLDEV